MGKKKNKDLIIIIRRDSLGRKKKETLTDTLHNSCHTYMQ